MSFERPSSGVRPTQSAPIDTPRSLAPRIDDIPREDGEFLVESAPSERQLHKAEFLTQLQNVIHEAAGQELTGTAWTAEQCPYIEYWFAYYQRRSASQIEAALRKYAPTTIDARNASDYLPAIAMRVREAVRRWRATGEVDAPPAAIPSPVEIMTSLGPGAELAGPVRSRMENAMHTSFADTRVHVDGRGAQAASEHSARAFAIGNHVAFGSGQYAPGTPVGDAMLAHELAHTVQQRGDASSTTTTRALEHAADRSAFTTMARLWGRGGLATQPTVHAGLSLQRCRVDQSEKTVPEAVETKLPDLPAVADKSGEEVLDPVDFAGWKPANKDALLFVVGTQTGSTEKQLFVLPAREFGVYVPPQPSAPSGTKPDPARRPGLALSASGHSSGLLINAGGGVGFYISVFGTPNGQGQPDMLLARGLQRLETELGITRVEDALVTHLHSDHAGGLVWMVRNHLIRGDRIYAPPGIGDVLAGALAAEAATLATGQVSALFAAGWRPRELTTRQINVNRPVTESTIEIGNTRTVMVVETSKLQAFRDAFASGGWSAATAKADAATPLTHVTWLNTGVEAIDTSDIRGRTIEDLYTALGDTAFRAHIGNARIVYGLHHLGTGLTAKDIRGHMRIFAAMGGGTQPITVIAQTGAPHAVNEAYIEALNIGGVRVVFLEDVDPAKPFANIKVRADGSVVHSGAQERGIRPETRDAQERLARMEAAAEMLERLSDYRGVDGATRQEVLDGLRAEIARLSQLLRARLEIATRDADKPQPTEQRNRDLAENTQAIQRVEGMEQRAGRDAIERLARGHGEINEISRELRESRVKAASSPRLREYLAKIDPKSAKEIFVDEFGKPMSRNQERKTWRWVEARLKKQARTESMIRETPQIGARAKTAAWIGLALEAIEIFGPAAEGYFASKNDREHEDFYMFFRDAVWWYEKGIRIPITGRTEDGIPPSLDASIERRLNDDAPKDQRKDLSKAAQSAKALKTLWVPELNEWTAEMRLAFFDTLRQWMSAHVNDWEDFFAEIKTGLAAPIRIKNDELPSGYETWQIHVGVLSDDHVHTAWQDSPELTKIMNETVLRSRRGTEARIADRIEKSKGTIGKRLDTYDDPASKTTSYGSNEIVTARLKVTAEKAGLYGMLNNKPLDLEKYAEPDTGLHLLELGQRSPPEGYEGYVWVTAADADSYYLLRNLVGWHFAEMVPIPKYRQNRDVNSPNFEAMPHDVPSKYMNAKELSAYNESRAGTKGYYFREDNKSEVWRGYVDIYEQGSNVAAMVLMKRKDLGPDQ